MKKYEYTITTVNRGKDEIEHLTIMGEEGWELCAVVHFIAVWYYFKREI
jgi:hypothetical protein